MLKAESLFDRQRRITSISSHYIGSAILWYTLHIFTYTLHFLEKHIFVMTMPPLPTCVQLCSFMLILWSRKPTLGGYGMLHVLVYLTSDTSIWTFEWNRGPTLCFDADPLCRHPVDQIRTSQFLQKRLSTSLCWGLIFVWWVYLRSLHHHIILIISIMIYAVPISLGRRLCCSPNQSISGGISMVDDHDLVWDTSGSSGAIFHQVLSQGLKLWWMIPYSHIILYVAEAGKVRVLHLLWNWQD